MTAELDLASSQPGPDFIPEVGIVVPAFKAEEFIERTLGAIVAQTYTSWECVVVNDGSPDNTAEAVMRTVARDSRIRLVNKVNGGVSSARNLGLTELSPSVKYVTFMDADDVWTPDALECLLASIRGDQLAIGAHGLADMIDVNDNPIDPGGFASFLRRRQAYDGKQISDLATTAPSDFASLIYLGHIYPPGTMLVKREAYLQVGLWDSSFIGVQDSDMNIRLSRLGHISFVDRVVVFYRRHSSNVTDRHDLMTEEVRRLYHKTFNSKENSEEQKLILKRGWRALQVYKTREKLSELRTQLRQGQMKSCAVLSAKIIGHALRWLRGYPTARGI